MLASVAGSPPPPVKDAPIERSLLSQPSESASQSRNSRLAKRMPELDGLRAIAVLLILVYHFFVRSPVLANDFMRGARTALTLGWSGVDLFLVLSGFLI